jgi:putative MATE family efflux protein
MTQDMTKGKPVPVMVRFAVPILLGSVINIIYFMVDGMIVGQFIGVNAFAAVGVSGRILWMMLSLQLGMVGAFSSIYSRRFGEKDSQGLRAAIAMSLFVIAIFGGMLSLGTFLGARQILLLMNTPPDIFGDALVYFRIQAAAMPIQFLNATVTAVLYSVGNSRTPFIAQSIAFTINIVLSLIVVLITPWGLVGVALVTVFGFALTCLICIIQIYRAKILRLEKADFRLSLEALKELFTIGLPLAIRDMPPAVVSLIVLREINGFGAAYTAGIAAGMKLYTVLFPLGESMSRALATFAGQNYGAKNYERAALGLRSALKIMLIGVAIIIAVMIPFREFSISLFIVGDEAALNVGVRQLSVIMLFLPTYYIAVAHRAYFPAVGNGFWPMISGFLEAATRLAVILILPGIIGEWGLYLAEVAGWPIMTLQLMIVYQIKKRQYNKNNS